ncbi:hypothetical protein [Roseobacter sp. A03A-229]
MQNEDSSGFQVEADPVEKTWDYVVTTIKPDGTPAVASDDDDVDIPDTILWYLAGGNVVRTTDGDDMARVEADPTPAVVYDMAPLKTVVLSSDEDGTLLRDTTGSREGGGLCDILVRDDDDDSGAAIGLKWVVSSDEGPAGPVHRDRVDSYDHETLEDIVEPGGPSAPDGEGLPDIVVHDDDDDSAAADAFEWVMAEDDDVAGPVHRDRVDSYDHETLEDIVETSGPSATDPGVFISWVPPKVGVDTISDFTDDTIIEVAPTSEAWIDLA